MKIHIMEKNRDQIDLIQKILRSDKTVFSFKDLSLMSRESSPDLKSKLNYYVKKGYLYSIRRGVYAKDKHYDKFELATKIYTPSYISFETVLARSGVIFQYYRQIFVASYKSTNITCDGQEYNFRKLKYDILINNIGIESNDKYSIASSERAFIDLLYLNKSYHFDNLSALNWDKIYTILPIYKNKRLEASINKYYQAAKDERNNK